MAPSRSPLMYVAVAMSSVVALQASATNIIPLTNDAGITSNPSFGTTKEGPLNDAFAYDPDNPASVLPQTSYAVAPADLWHSPGGVLSTDYAVQFGDVYTNIIVDFYARTDDPGAYNRDDNLTFYFFNGSWNAADLTHTQFNVNINNAAVHNRITIPDTVEADRFRIFNSSSTNWSIAELRAIGVPEPSSLALLGVCGFVLARRRRSS